MLVPFLKLELCVLVDRDGNQAGLRVEFQQGIAVDREVYEHYHRILSLAVQAALQELDDASTK